MIVSFYTDDERTDEDNCVIPADLTAITNGCGCCSGELYLSQNREDIIKHLKRNVELLDDICAELGMTIDDLRKE